MPPRPFFKNHHILWCVESFNPDASPYRWAEAVGLAVAIFWGEQGSV